MEEETYSLIFKSLKHPIRRKILRMLVGKQMSFSEILNILSIDSGHLSYHIENLGELIRHSENGKYELSSIGIAAVNLMSGVEEHPHLPISPSKWKTKKTRNIFLVAVLVTLMASAVGNAYYYNLLQSSLQKNVEGTGYALILFDDGIYRATSISYLLLTYRHGLRETEPNELNIKALIKGFFNEMEYAYYFGLKGLMALNPELSGYRKPLYIIDRFMCYTFIQWKSCQGGPTVRSVLENLIAEAESLANYSRPLAAFKELNQTSFQKLQQLSFEVLESFATPFNATRLENTINIVNDLENVLAQWLNKYA
ncbi:MAG: winged helix-turn-helix domain-containing protein [Candidatus Bathyarchaeia archaeon]